MQARLRKKHYLEGLKLEISSLRSAASPSPTYMPAGTRHDGHDSAGSDADDADADDADNAAATAAREIDFEVEELDEISGEVASPLLLPPRPAATTATTMDSDDADNADADVADAGDPDAGAEAAVEADADAASTLAAAAGGATLGCLDDAVVDAPAAPAVSPPPDRSHEWNEREDRWAGAGAGLGLGWGCP